ncbi:DUF748 domain-containing protein [Xylophilus sp. Kf1]|nr:DUF748 domain-containing protein [Xylophilus sp. Kf1]
MPATTSAHRPLWLRAAIVAAWVAGALVVLMALAWVGVPPLARWQIETRATEKLGRAVTVARVGFSPWTMRTTLEDLTVAGLPGADSPLLRVERVGFRTALSSLWQRAPVVEALQIDRPQLRLTRLAAGRYDIDDLIARLSNPAEPDAAPARYVLRDFRLASGSIDFEDRAVAGRPARHTVRDLQLALPAISSLAADRDSEVAPTLAFTLDGSRFDSSVEALPYAELRQGEAHLQVAGLDLARLQGYWPAGLPLRPQAGTLEARLKVAFSQNAAPAGAALEISGELLFKGLSLHGADGREALAAESLKVQIARLAPLQRRLQLERVELVRPRLKVARDAAGHIDLVPAAAPPGPAAPVASPAWRIELARLLVRGGEVDWRDALVPTPVHLPLRSIELDAGAMAWPMKQPAELRGSAELPGPGGTARVAWSGSAGVDAGRLKLQASGLQLAWAQPYLQGRLQPALQGALGTDATVAWSAGGVQAEAPTVTVDRPALVQGGKTLFGADRVALKDLAVDTVRRSVAVGRLDIAAPTGQVSRDARGVFMFADWWSAPSAPSAPVVAPTAAAGEVEPWRVAVKALQLQGGQIGWRDTRPARPVALDLSGLQLQASDLAWPLSAGSRGYALQLDTRIAAGQSTPGSLRFKGTVVPDPLLLDGRLDTQRLPVQLLEPYFGDAFNVQLVRADLGFAGTLRLALPPAGLELRVQGDIGVDNVRVDSATPDAPADSRGPVARRGGVLTSGARRASSLFSWKTLQFRTATLKIAPGQPLFWGVYDTTLGDFFARLSINEKGRLNLRDLARAPAGAPQAGAAKATGAARPAGAEKTAAAAAPPELHFGETHFANGRVQFTDNFIQPSYSLALSELEGVLGAFDSVGAVYLEPAMATLDLRGKAEGSAGLQVKGKLNPLANPLAVDVVAKVDDLDLPALSPYSVKYAGYGIQRGKLSMEAHYQIQPDGQLSATNSLLLRQLVFDEQADGGKSNLPVRLAAALLADSNGVIDLDLPISGSLNDPQFSLGPVIGKALMNLFTRIVTSPFSLLRNAFGGSAAVAAETLAVPFAVGSAELSDDARKALDGIAQSLVAKPVLQLTVSGTASTDDADREAEGFRRERLRQLARFEKRRALIAAAPTAAPPAVAQVTVTAPEYPALLRKVYAATDMPKPRNLIGIARELPVEEMERLLAEQIDVGDDTLRGLALQRGVAVRDYLASHGVPAARVFLGAVRLNEKPVAGWSPSAQLRLSLP